MIEGPPAPAIVPWRLPRPDVDSTDERYLATLRALYAYSETPRAAAAVELGRERKLDRMRTLLGLAGSPQSSFATVLVAGTKGKGSMAAMLASILHAAGYRVGRYTQPHLYSHRERIWANGAYISEVGLVDGYEQLRPALAVVERHADELGPLTTFDAGTALALGAFARERVEIAVVEVGVGGANDATNALEPILALIGPVGIDHADTLGPTIDAIARHKAGIMRSGIDAIVSRQVPEAQHAIAEVASRIGAHLVALGRDFTWQTDDETSRRFSVVRSDGVIDQLEMPLQGPCQRDNAAVAVTSAVALRERGWNVTDSSIHGGLAHLEWPGRFQTAVVDPLTIVDGAHNPAAMRALADTIRECIPGAPVTLVIGMSSEKDVYGSVSELAPLVQDLVVTRARHARSCDPARLVDAATSLGLSARVVPDPEEAVRSAWDQQPEGGVTLVAGSLFLAGDVLEWLWRRGGGSSDN